MHEGNRCVVKFDELSHRVIGCAIEVHRQLGPGLLESAYEQCLSYEFTQAGIRFQTQLPLPVKYKEIELDCTYRIDMFVDNQLIIELESIDQLLNIHEAQVLTYMKLAKVNVGLLINFNLDLLQKGIKRFVL